VNVSLCREDGIYRAGGLLHATWQISRVPLEQIQGIEISVMWHTEGKGDEDLHVHHFHRISEHQIRRTGLADQQRIQCQLPITPLSYDGRLIRIKWCIRLRLFMASGKEIVAEQPFYLVTPTGNDAPTTSMTPGGSGGNASPMKPSVAGGTVAGGTVAGGTVAGGTVERMTSARAVASQW